MAPPSTPPEELKRRLEIANEKRFALADLRRKIREGKVDIKEMLRDLPECVIGTPYTDLLKQIPGIGPSKVETLMTLSGMPDRNITPIYRSAERLRLIRLIERWEKGELSLRSGKEIS